MWSQTQHSHRYASLVLYTKSWRSLHFNIRCSLDCQRKRIIRCTLSLQLRSDERLEESSRWSSCKRRQNLHLTFPLWKSRPSRQIIRSPTSSSFSGSSQITNQRHARSWFSRSKRNDKGRYLINPKRFLTKCKIRSWSRIRRSITSCSQWSSYSQLHQLLH